MASPKQDRLAVNAPAADHGVSAAAPARRAEVSLAARVAGRASKPFFGLSALLLSVVYAITVAVPALRGAGSGNTLLVAAVAGCLLLRVVPRAHGMQGLAAYWLLMALLSAVGMFGARAGISSGFSAVFLVCTLVSSLFLAPAASLLLWFMSCAVLVAAGWMEHAGLLTTVRRHLAAEAALASVGATLAFAMVYLWLREAARLEDELSQARLQQTMAVDAAQERERERIARDLHDDLQQSLGVIRLELALIGQQVRVDQAPLHDMLGRANQLTAAAIESTRRIVNDLRPQMLDELGLLPALHTLVRNFARDTDIQGHFEVLGAVAHGDADSPLARTLAGQPQLTTCLYRVAQEATNNVRKHAQARRLHVEIGIETRDQIVLRITDDGRGIGPADLDKPQSLGLLGMRERLRTVDGRLRVIREPAGGTTIEARVALKLLPP